MPLQFIIDGYNIIHNVRFTPLKKIKDQRLALLELIRSKRLSGSPKNKVAVVFDGYPHPGQPDYAAIGFAVIFAGEESADERIKRLADKAPDPKNTMVVSDDKEVVFYARAAGCRVLGVKEFLPDEKAAALLSKKKELTKAELNYSQMHKINEELKKLWLK